MTALWSAWIRPTNFIDLVVGSANPLCSVGDGSIASLYDHVLVYVQVPANFAYGNNSSYAHLAQKGGHISRHWSAVDSDPI